MTAKEVLVLALAAAALIGGYVLTMYMLEETLTAGMAGFTRTWAQ